MRCLIQASLCMKNLDGAASNVTDEMRKLEEAGERCVESAIKAFEEVTLAVDHRRDELIATIRRIRDEKKRVLREQLNIIESERSKIRSDCDGLQVRKIGQTFSKNMFCGLQLMILR